MKAFCSSVSSEILKSFAVSSFSNSHPRGLPETWEIVNRPVSSVDTREFNFDKTFNSKSLKKELGRREGEKEGGMEMERQTGC